MCRTRWQLLFHMDEMPLLELKFYARRLSHFYFLMIVLSIVLMCTFKYEKLWTILDALEICMLFVNFCTIRLVIHSATKCNTLASIAITCILEVIVIISTAICIVKGYYTPAYLIVSPIIWILLELTTIMILYGFYRKMVVVGETEVQEVASARANDKVISYSHNTALNTSLLDQA